MRLERGPPPRLATLVIRRSAFGVRRSAFGVRRSAFGVQRSLADPRPSTLHATGHASLAANNYRFFFPADFLEPDGITLATVLAIELAIVATTPFFGFAFALGFALAVGFVLAADFVFVLGALLVFDLGLVAAFFAIANSATR